MPGAIAMINVVGNLARGRPPRRPRPPLGDGGRHQDGCPAAARARAAVKPFECCRPHRFRPGTKASNTPNLEATTGQTPKELQSGFEFTGEEIDARDIAARPREGRDQTAPDRDPRRVPKTIRWASMPAASSRGRSAPTRFSTAGGSKLQLVSCSSNAKVSPPGLRLHQAKLSRKSNQLARGRFRQFESYMPSHAVISNRGSAKEKLRPEGSARRAVLGPTHVQAALGRPCWAAAPSRSVRSTPSQNC